MGKDIIGGLVSIAIAILGIAMVAVIVGSKSQTSQILSTGGSAFAKVLEAATSAA